MLNLRLVTPPTAEPITLRQAKIHLRLIADTDPEDTPPAPGPDDSLIERLISTARTHCEAYTTLLITDAVYELRTSCFSNSVPWECPPRLYLPYGRIKTIESFEYLDADGAVQDVDPLTFSFDDNPARPSIRLAYDQTWPDYRREPDGVRVQFKGDPENVPSDIMSAMLLMIGTWYEAREDSVAGSGNVLEIPMGARYLMGFNREQMGV